MDKNYIKTILSGIKEWTRSLIQKTADNAQATADNAQATADNAQATADNAQATADNAQATADNAQATADNAQATADNAQATADNALHLQISYDDQLLIWDGTTTTTESTVQVEYFTTVGISGGTKKTRYYRISDIPNNIVKYALAHYKDIKCAIKVQNGTENELELTNDWYGNSHLCVSSSRYYILIARESGSHAVRIPGALQPVWLNFPQAGIYIGYCTDSSVEGDAGKSFTHKIALPTYGLPLDSVVLTTDSDKNIQVVDTETGTKKTLKSAYSYAQDGGYTGTEAEFAAKLAAEKLPNPYPLTFTGAVNETYDGSSAKTIEIPSGGSGAHSDWNQNDSTAADYIKNRPFYTGDPVETVLVEESTVSFTDRGQGLYMAQFESTFALTVGGTYKVSWDGTVYECTCFDLGEGGLVIGNLSIAGAGSDTGEPFLMGVYDGRCIIYTLDTSASHTFSISGFVAEVVKIDRKYIPALDYLDKNNPTGAGSFSMNREINSDIGEYSVALGEDCIASGNNSISAGASAKATELVAQAFGWRTEANARFSHAEGCHSKVSANTSEEAESIAMEEGAGRYGHAEGFCTLVTGGGGAHAEGALTSARGSSSHAEGWKTIASGSRSHAEGIETTASGDNSHAEGYKTTASGNLSHAEGGGTTASESLSHAEGNGAIASGEISHAEGDRTTASGQSSHAEGGGTTASGSYSHAEGSGTTASGKYSHAEGYATTASSDYQHVQGKYNIEDPSGTYADIVGNGTQQDRRSNAYTLDWEGNAWYSGTIEGKALILPSSTAGSTKKFKITVDDSGTISATEVV